MQTGSRTVKAHGKYEVSPVPFALEVATRPTLTPERNFIQERRLSPL